jgi:uncharacterized protein (DUF2164 family)
VRNQFWKNTSLSIREQADDLTKRLQGLNKKFLKWLKERDRQRKLISKLQDELERNKGTEIRFIDNTKSDFTSRVVIFILSIALTICIFTLMGTFTISEDRDISKINKLILKFMIILASFILFL